MNAGHFRQRAAKAREMAQTGGDFRLSRMLLDVAQDLDAEAEAIEGIVMMGDGASVKHVAPGVLSTGLDDGAG